MTRSDQQKKWERHYLDVYRRLSPDFPVGTLNPANPQAPDILLRTTDRIIGIELTRFLSDVAGPSGSPSRALDAFRSQILKRAKQIWQCHDLPPVDVSLMWDDRLRIDSNDVESIAQQFVEFASLQIPDVNCDLTFTYPNPRWMNLPSNIAAMFVSRPAGLNETVWNFSHGGSVPHVSDIFGELQHILDKKQGKVSRYRQHCQELWLLIVADGSNVQSMVVIDEDVPAHSLVSSFDKALFLSAPHERVIRLSLVKTV